MNFNWYTFPNHGYITTELPPEILAKFNDVYKAIKDGTISLKPFNKDLAGQLTEEYSLEHLIPEVKDCFNTAAKCYVSYFGGDASPRTVSTVDSNEKYDIELKSLWLNIQKKGEYNPLHDHTGVLSFALWLKIPYLLEDERKLSNTVRSNMHCNGQFSFYYTNILGEINGGTIADHVYKEGVMAVFPAQLRHAVYPFFTSDEDRVSVSGNFYYKERK